MREVEIGAKIQRRLCHRNSEPLDQIPAVRHSPPSKAAVEEDYALSLGVFKVVEDHKRIILTPYALSI